MRKRRTFILGTVRLLGVLAAVIFLTTTPSRFRPPSTSGVGQSQSIATPKKSIKIGPYEGSLAPNFSAPRFRRAPRPGGPEGKGCRDELFCFLLHAM